MRMMSTGSASIKSRFEEAYTAKQAASASRGAAANTPQPENKALYGQGYYSNKINTMRQGYVHPYHTAANPLVYSHYNYLRHLMEAVGPEQVSPHYESLSRSRRGLIFLFFYVGTITSLSRMGGWSHNEWLRGMLFHHEFLIAWYIGVVESRHFTYMIGPKFTIFYNVYSKYEIRQMAAQWVDTAEEIQMKHLVHTKAQMEYVRINKEYEFVKKRALVNYLENSRDALEGHMHSRANNMLASVAQYEQTNLKKVLSSIGEASFAKVTSAMADPAQKDKIMDAAFASALLGIRSGVMTYENDPLMPILETEVNNRTAAYANLSAQEESDLLMLTPEQKQIIAGNDRRAKDEFLTKLPAINNPGVRMHPKFQAYAASTGAH